MQVTKVSSFSGEAHTMELPITQEEIQRWGQGELIQDVWPDLTADQREFLISGITPEEWRKVFG